MKYLKTIYVCLLLFSSFNCSSQRKTNDMLATITNDYISEYSSLKFEKLTAIFICQNNQGETKIIDISNNAANYYLGEGKYCVKRHSKVLCFYDFQNISLNSTFFSKIPERLKRKAEKKNKLKEKIKIFNTILEISNEPTEWNYRLEIIYHLNETENTFSKEVFK